MRARNPRFEKLFASTLAMVATAAAGCSDANPGATRSAFNASSAAPASVVPGGPSAAARLAACNADPRVVTGLVSREVCAGADIFFRETFAGNGRTCGTCHPAQNNTTIDAAFVRNLHEQNPSDPLFVFETNPALANLESADSLFNNGVVLENVDGFEDPLNKFVVRSVPHVLSLSTTIAADSGDGTTTPKERVGWGGDGAPGDGSLRSFLTGAITQHLTKSLARQPGVDFRLPTDQELDLTNTFQRSLGRTNELNLTR